MSNVKRIRHELSVSVDIALTLATFDLALVKAINEVREAGLPQGIVVALLHGQAHSETVRMAN